MRGSGRKGEIAKAILFCLVVAGAVSLAATAPNAFLLLKPLLEKGSTRRVNKESLRRAIKRLHEKKMISLSVKGGKTILEITEKGKKRVREFEFDEMALEIPKKWDKRWTIILFDIPETRKVVRDALHRKLVELGCYQFNKSVFVYPSSCDDEIDFVSEFFSVSPYVTHFETFSLGVHEYRARKFFGLV